MNVLTRIALFAALFVGLCASAISEKKSDRLFKAAIEGNAKELESALQNGASVNARDRNGVTPLMYAALSGRARIVEILLNNKANIDEKDKAGNTALIMALGNSYTDVAKTLILSGANVNIRSSRLANITPLMFASMRGYTEIVGLAIEKEAELNAPDANGVTALMWASSMGHLETVRLLVEKGADANLKDKVDRKTALQVASERGRRNVAAFLRSKGAK